MPTILTDPFQDAEFDPLSLDRKGHLIDYRPPCPVARLGSADGGLVGAKSNAWDSSPAPRVGWDVMLDNYEGTKSAMGYHFEKKMNCLPEQLMASFYRVSSQ